MSSTKEAVVTSLVGATCSVAQLRSINSLHCVVRPAHMRRYLHAVHNKPPTDDQVRQAMGVPTVQELMARFGLSADPSAQEMQQLHKSKDYIKMVTETTANIVQAACKTINDTLPAGWIDPSWIVMGIRAVGTVGVVLSLFDKPNWTTYILKLAREVHDDYMPVEDEVRVQRLMHKLDIAPAVAWHKKHGHLHGILTQTMAVGLTGFLACMVGVPEPTRVPMRRALVRGLQDLITTMRRAGLTHGDFHVGNIMIDTQGRLLAIDFGQASCTTSNPVVDAAQFVRSIRILSMSTGGSGPDKTVRVDETTKDALEGMMLRVIQEESGRDRHHKVPQNAHALAAAWADEHKSYTPSMGCSVHAERLADAKIAILIAERERDKRTEKEQRVSQQQRDEDAKLQSARQTRQRGPLSSLGLGVSTVALDTGRKSGTTDDIEGDSTLASVVGGKGGGGIIGGGDGNGNIERDVEQRRVQTEVAADLLLERNDRIRQAVQDTLFPPVIEQPEANSAHAVYRKETANWADVWFGNMDKEDEEKSHW